MKLRAIISTIACLTFAFVLGSASLAQQKTGAPKLVVDKVDFDFGKVTEGKPLSHTFKLKNEGSAELVIKNVSPACGCTASEFSKVIAPGAEGTVTLTIKTDGMSGKTSRYADVISNDVKSPNLQLWVHMDVQKKQS